MPLDILKKDPGTKKTEYHESCDMWSVGIIAYALLTGILPLMITKPKEMLAR